MTYNMCWHDHLHVLKLATCQGHRSVEQLRFAHLLLFRWLTITVWNFLIGWSCRSCCLVGSSSFLFLCLHCRGSISSCSLVIIRIHVDTLMLVCGLLVILLDHGKELDVDMFSPCNWIQLLHKHCYLFVPCVIPCPCHCGKSYPTWCGQYSMLLPHSQNCG